MALANCVSHVPLGNHRIACIALPTSSCHIQNQSIQQQTTRVHTELHELRMLGVPWFGDPIVQVSSVLPYTKFSTSQSKIASPDGLTKVSEGTGRNARPNTEASFIQRLVQVIVYIPR